MKNLERVITFEQIMIVTLLLTIVHITLLAGIAFVVWRAERTAFKRIFWPALAVKLAAGVCLGLLYRYYFPVADTFVYFKDASRVAQLARNDIPAYLELLFLDRHVETLSLTFQEPRALFLTKLTSIFNILTADNYWICGLYFSFCSFLATWYLVRTVVRYIPSARSAAVVAFLFFPSVVFWTSGLLKESLAMAALFLLAALFLTVWFEGKIGGWQFLAAIISLMVFWKLKYYYVAVFVPVALTSLLYHFFLENRLRAGLAFRILIWCGIFLLPLAIISFLHPNFNAARILGVIVTNNTVYNQLSDPGDYIRFNDLSAAPLSILRNAPRAVFSGLFRPLFWESRSIVQFLAAAENACLLILFCAALLRLRRFVTSPHRLLIASALVFVLLLTVFITISAPNFGTLSRYRVGYLAFFVFVILCDNPVLQYLERTFPRLVSH